MCDCFHLVLPNWQGSPASGSGRQLRPPEPPGDADAVADAEDEDSVNEVAVEDIRPRPQGSSPVYEYPVEEDYLKLQEENKKHSTDKSKQSHPQETMEVTLKTEVEAGASGFSVKGGGNEGIFIKRVLKESPASKIFSLREGDQLLSATIFFDNIKYEDALKILQYSEPYRVQFSLKRKIAVQEDPEHSTAQHKKERIGQEKELSDSIPEEALHVSGKAISEEDRETLIVSQRIGRSKRPKKDRLSWPKFQSIKNKKILRHRRSHSTSDAYEPAIQDISPTSTDTESQFPQEVHTKEKKGSQRKLKFPSIGFRMHRSKAEPQEKQKKEIKTTLITEREKMHKDDISLENPEILTVEYTTSPAYEMKTGEGHETLTKDLKEMKNGIPSHVKQCPEVEISIKKEKDKEATSEFSVPEVPDITIEIPKPSLETADLKVSPTKKSPQASSKSRKKKQKGAADKKDRESGINIDLMGHTAKESVQVKGLEIGTAKAELQTSDTLKRGDKQTEEDKQILNIQKINYGISMPKRKETETDTTKKGSNVPQSEPEKTADMTSQDSMKFNVKTLMLDGESEVSSWKIQIPSFKEAKAPKTDMKISRDESKEDTEERVKKEGIEEDGMPTDDKALNIEIGMKTGEKDTEGKESKFRLPKLKFPTFTWSTTKEETAVTETEINERERKLETLENAPGLQLSGTTGEIMVTRTQMETGISIGKQDERDIKQKTIKQLPSPKKTKIKCSEMEMNAEGTEENTWNSKPDNEREKREFTKKSKHDISEMPKADIKAPKVDISLPSVDVSLPQASVYLQAPEATLSLEGEAKIPEVPKTKDGKFKMPKFGMPSFGWSSSRDTKGTMAAEVDVSLKEPQVAVPSGTCEVDVTLPATDIQAPGVEVTVETAAVAAEGEKGRFKMPDVKMPSVKLPKVKGPQVQVSVPKVEVSLPKGQEGEVALQGPEAEASLEVATGKAEGGGMKIHMPKVKVPSVVFSKPTVKSPKLDADVSLPQAELKAADVSISAPDVKLLSVEGSLELQAPDIDLKAPSAEGKLALEGTGLKGKLKLPKFDKPKFSVSTPKVEAPAAEASPPSAEVDLPSATVTVTGEGPALGLKADIPGAKSEGTGLDLEKPSLKMPKADIKAPKVDISLPSVDVSLPQASVDLQAPEATLGLEGEAKIPEVPKTKDGKFKMPKFGMPSFGWSSSRDTKGTVAAEVDVSLKEPQVAVPTGTCEVDVTLPATDIQAPGVEVTVETAAVAAEGEKGRFKMPDVKMPSVKLPKVKGPQVQVSVPKAEVSLPKGQEGEVALQGPEAEASLEVATGKAEGGGMKIHMPKVKVPSVVFSKPTVKSPKLDADVSLPQAELKAADVSISAPDVKLPSVEGSLELQAPDIDLKAPSAEGKLELEGTGLKGKLKLPKFDKPKFSVSTPKVEAPAAEASPPSAEVDLPSATVTVTGEGPALGLKADIPGAKSEGTGLDLEKPSLKMPKADIKAPKVDISLPSVDVSLPQASVYLQAPEATLSLEGEAKIPEVPKTKDGKFKMPKFGMPSFGWSSSRDTKGTMAAEVDVSLKEPQVAVPSGTCEVDVTLPATDIQAPGVEVTVETAAVAAEGEKGRFKMPDVKMPSVKLPKVKGPQVQVSVPKAEVSLPKGQEGEVALQGPEAEASLEVATGKAEGGGMKIHMPKVKVPSVVFSKPTVKSPKLDADVSLPQAELKAADVSISAPDVKLPSVEGSLELQAPDIDLKAPSAEGKLALEGTGLKGKLKLPKFDKPKFSVSTPKVEAPAAEASPPSAEVDLPSATVTVTGEGPALGLKADIPGAKSEGTGLDLEKPSLKMPKADIKAPKVDISLPSVDVSLPQASVDLQAPEATLGLEGEAKIPEVPKTKDGKFKMPKFGMPSFGWSSSRDTKGTVAAEVDVSLKEPQVAVPSGTCEVDVTLPTTDIQAPGVEVTVETAAVAAEGEKGRFKMPDVKMPSVKLPKVKGPQVQVSVPKAEVSLPKGQEGEVALQGPEAEASLEVATGKAEGGGMKIHMPKVKVPSVVFSKPTVKSPKLDADVSLPQAELKAADVSISAPDVKLPSVEGSLELQAPDIDLKATSAEGKLELEGTGLKGKLKLPKFDKPKFSVSTPKVEAPAAEASPPSAEVDLPSATVTVTGEGPALGLKADIPGAKSEGTGLDLEKPSLKMPKADIKAPKVDISLPSVNVSLPQASVDLQAPEATLSLEGEAKIPEVPKTKDGKFKMPKFGMPSFGWSSSRDTKGTVAAEVDVSLKEPQVAVPSGTCEVDVTLPTTDIQAPGVEVTVETAAIAAEGEKGRFKMPDIKMPSVKLPKVKGPQVQVSVPKAEVSLPKGQEGEVALQGPEAEASLEVATGKAEGGGMKIHMPKVKVPSVVFSKPTVKSPKLDADVSLPQAELKAADISISAPDVKLPSVEGSLELQAPDIDLKAPSAEGKLALEGTGLKGKLKLPKFDKPKFSVSTPKVEAPAAEASPPSAEVDLPSATVTVTGEGPVLGLKADIPGAKSEGTGLDLEKPSLKMPKADIKAPKVDISLPSVDVSLPQASVDLQAPEATLSLEGEAKIPEVPKTKDGKFKMPKFGMPSFGWSSSRDTKGTVAAEVDVSLKEPQVAVPSGTCEVDVTLPATDIQAPGVEVTVETAAVAAEGEKGRFKMPDVKMPSVKLPKVKGPQAQVSVPKAEVSLPKGQEGEVALQGPEAEASLEVATGKAEGGGMKIHMPKVKVPSVVFSKPTVKSPKLDADVSLPQAELKAADISISAPDVKLPSVEGSLELQAPDIDLKAPSAEGKLALEGTGLKGKLKLPKFDKPKFSVSTPKVEAPAAEASPPSAEVDLPSATVTVTGEGPALGLKADIPGAKSEGTGLDLEKPSLKMPKADIKAPKVDISLPSVDVSLPQASVDLQAPEATLSLEGEAKIPEVPKTKDGKFKMPKFGMPSFGWSSSRDTKGTMAAEVDVSLKEPQVAVPSGTCEVDVTLPATDIQAPGVEVTVETAAVAAEGEKGRFKMPDVKMPSVKLPKVKGPQVQVSVPKAEVSLPKGQEGEVALQGPEAEASLEVATGKAEGGGMKIHMPKVKVPSVVFSKPTVKSPKLDADVSLPQAELKAADVSISAPDVKLPSVEGSLELQAPDIDLKAPSAEGKLALEGTGLKGKLKLPKFDKPKFSVSTPKVDAPAAEASPPSAEVDLPSATVTVTGEGPALGLKADIPGAKSEGTGLDLEKPSLKMPKADIKAPKVDISLPSVNVSLPQASVDLQAPEATLGLEGEAKIPEVPKTKDGKFKMPKFGMPSFGWSSSRDTKGTVAAEVDVSLKEPQVAVPSGTCEVDVTLPTTDIQAPGVEVTVETAAIAAEGEKGRFKMPDIKMPSVKLPKVKGPQVQVSVPKAEVSLPKGQEGEVALQGPEAEASLEVATGKAEGGGMKIHMPKVKVPSVVFSKPTVKSPKLDADVSLPQAELKAADISISAPDVKLPSVEGSLELQAPDIDLKAPSAEGKLALEGTGLKGKLKLPKFDKPKFSVSTPKVEAPAAEASPPSAEVDLPSATVTVTGEGPVLGLKADIPGAKSEGTGLDLEKPSLKMPKADIKAPKVDISLPSVDVSLPQASVDLQAPEATLSLEGEAKIPEVPKTKDGKFKMPKFGMPSFGWSSSRDTKGTMAAEVDVSLKEPQVAVPSGTCEVDVTLPATDIQAPGVEVTVETAAVAAEGEKGRFKMPDVKMPSVKLPKVKGPQAQVSVPKAEVSLPKGQEGEVALQGPEAEASLEVATGKAEGGGMKIHMPKVKVPSVVFSKPTVKSPKLNADVSLPQAELKAADISISAPDVKLPSVEGSLELQAPDIDLKAPSAEGKLALEGTGLKGKLKLPKFDKPKFSVSTPKVEAPAAEASPPSAEVDLPSATVTVTGEGPALGLKADIPGAKSEGTGLDLEKPSLKMPKADIKAPKVDISLPSVDVSLPQASVDLQAPEATLSLEGEAKIPEVPKTKDGKFKMPKFGMPSFGWSSSRDTKGTMAAEVDVSLKEPQVAVPSGTCEVDVTLPTTDIQAPGVEVTVETAAVAAEGEKGRFKMPDIKMPSVKLPKFKGPQVQVSVPKAEVSLPKGQEGEVALQGPEAEASLEVATGKAEGGGKKIHVPKVKVPSVVFSKPTVKSPKLDADVSLPQAELKAADVSISAPDVKLPSVEGSLELQAPDIDLKAPSAEGKLALEGTGLKGKLKLPKFDKPKFSVFTPKVEAPAAEASPPSAEVDLPSATVTVTGEGPALGLKADIPGAKSEGMGLDLEKPSLKMPKADIKAPKVDISLPSVDVSLPQASVDLQAPEATLGLEGEAKIPDKQAAKTKDGKFKMPKFGMPSFGLSSSRDTKGTVAAEVDVSLKEPQVAVPLGTCEVDVTLPATDIQAPGVEVTVETAAIAAEGEKGRFKMPSVKLPKVKGPQAQVSVPKAEVSLPKGQEGEVTLQGPEAEASLEVAAGKAEGGGMKIHMPKVKVPSVVFSKPTVKSPKLDADVSLPQAELKAADVSISAPDVKLPSVEGSLELQAPDIDLKAPSAEGKLELEGTGLKGKLKLPKFDKPKFSVSTPKVKAPTAEASPPSAEVDLPSATVTVTGEGPALGLKADIPGAKSEGTGLDLEKPSLKMPKADIKAPKVDISLPSVDVSLPQASVDLQAPEATLGLEGEAKIPEVPKTKDGKFKMPKFGMPSFGWSSSRDTKGTVAAEVDVSLKEPQVAVPSGTCEVDVTLPATDIQAPGVEVTVETAAIAVEGEKGRFKMPDVKMPSVKLPKVKGPQVQVSVPKAEVSLPKGQESEVTLQGPEAEASLEVAAGKAEGGGMKIHMPKVKVPSVVFSKPTVKSPKLDADVSLPQAELKAADVSISAPDVKLPSVEGSLELQAPDIDLKAPSAEGKLELEGTGLKGQLKLPKFDKPKFSVSSPKVEAPAAEVSPPSAEVDLPSATVTVTGEGPALGLKADIPGAKSEGTGLDLEKPSLKMPKADIKAPKVDISLPSVDVSLPQASIDLQAPEATLGLEGEAKIPEVPKTKDGKFKMPKFGMPSFGWSSSRDTKGTMAAEVDVSLKESQVTVPSGPSVAGMTLPDTGIQEPCFDISLDSSSSKEHEIRKSKSSAFRMPKISFSHNFKTHPENQSECDFSVSETLCSSLTEDTFSVPSESVGSKHFPDTKGESVSKNTKFRFPSLSFSKAEVTSSKIDMESSFQKGDITLTKYQINLTQSPSKIAPLADENLSDFEILSEDISEEQGGFKLDGKTTSAEISSIDTEVTVKIPKFRKPKFRIRSKGKASESDIDSNVESEIYKGRITSDMTDPDTEKPAQISDAQLGVKLHKPSPEVVLDAPTVDPNLSPMEVTLPKLEAESHGPDLKCKAEQEAVTGEKGTEEKENKFKSSKFKLPSFRWSPKKEAVAPSHIEEHLEGPTLSTLSEDMGSELTFPTPENQCIHDEFDTTEKDGEKAKTKKSQFTMPKISFPKIKGQKVQVSLPILETDVSGPKQDKEDVSVQIPEKGSSGEGAGLGIKVPKVTVPALEFSKPEAKAPKIEMDISMPTDEVTVPTCEDELTLKSAAANSTLSTSDIEMIPQVSLEVKSPDIIIERTSGEIAVGDVQIKAEGSQGKTKMSKFQMPKVGIALSKGKGSEKDDGQSKSEVKVPQLKATIEISDIAVEAPDLEVEHGTETETYSPEAKITKTDSKASEADVHLPSADISIPKTDSDIQDSDAAVKIKGEIKQDGDGEEKEGHFKMPKFKLPSFSWSPKKEASVKSDSGANLEDQKLAVMTSRIDTEVKGTATDDQGSGPDLDLEIPAGKVEQKSPMKKPQFVMPKISLSKIKVPKSQSHSPKVGADATLPKREIEGDDSIKIPDIEKSHPEGTEEGTQISIKLADTTKFSEVETEASKTEITVSSAKIDGSLTPSEESFQQVDLKISSTNECNIQKTGIKLPKGEASLDLKSPDISTESSSVVDGRKMKLEGPEGKIKMPKFQKTKFGISLTKGKVPETEISSPKIEAELPQLRTTNEIADIAVGVPASELISDMSDSGGVDSEIITPQALMGGSEDAKVDVSTQSMSKTKTEGVIESLEEKEIKLKEHDIKAEEVQTEEYQGWFKMPKFRIPAFGRSSVKEKKSDADTERSMEKAQATIPSAKVQTETSIPENTFSLPHAVAEITIGKEGIQKLGDSVISSDVSLPKMEGDISLSTEKTDSRMNIPKTETYADVVKRSAEEHTSETTVSAAELSKSYSSETDKGRSSTNRFPTCTLTFPEHKGKSRDIEVPKVGSSMKLETSGVGCKASTGEITLDATQKKIDVSLPKGELDIQNKEAAIKKGKIKGEVKIIGKDSEESQLKRTTCEWSTPKGSEDGTYVTAKLEDLKVEVPTVKTDVKITEVDPEMKFQVKNVEKDVSAGVEVQVEDRVETSKIKAYKFKIPKFGMLRSEIKGFEDYTNLPKSEADSASESLRGTAEMQLQKPEGSIDLKSPALDHTEASAIIRGETVDQTQGVPEVSVRIPKLKIPRFTFRTLPIEADVLLSKVVTDPKGSSTDIEIVQVQASSAIPEEPGALEGGIQKAKSKILTLTEPDIKTAQMTATIESSLSSAGQDFHWSYIEGQEVSEKVEPEHVAIERCEIYTTEILKESEILSSEVKTATLGFSLLKTKLPESHSDLDVLVQQPSPTGGASVRKLTDAGERAGSAELKLSDKPHRESEESRGKVSLTKLKTSTAEVKCSSKLEESFPDKSPEGITAASLSKDEDAVEAVEGEEKDMANEKEKTDSKRSPGRFKFWLPSIGFSSSGDETSTDAKPEIKKSVPEDVKPADTSDDSSKQADKTGWFRFPKLGFTSPSKKAKSVDKEEVGHKEGRLSDEDSPTDKPDVFFDAQESLSPKEIGEGEKAEIDGASSIVTSSARTELILLEEEKDIKSNIVGDTTK
ncbi:protein AHNAK2 [Acridotheres tristis]